MTSTQHTPGPWQHDWHFIVAPDPNGIHPNIYIAEIAEADSDGRIASPEQQEANGRLIAASPELLAACQLVITRWDRGDLAEAARACQTAVESATGDGPPWEVTDALPATRMQKIALKLLMALEEVINYAENEAYYLEYMKDSPETSADARRALKAVEAGRDAIAQAKRAGAVPQPSEADGLAEA